MPTSYSRRTGDYLYDIEVREETPPPPQNVARFCARIVNMVRAKSQMSVNADLQDEYGATVAEAVAQIEAVVEKWVKGETVSVRAATAARRLL
jgi:hypothetical protein